MVGQALEELSECLPGDFDLERTVENRELLRCIDGFLAKLPERERVIFVGRYFYLLTVEELAERLRMKSATVKTVLYRTRAKLLRELEKEGVTDERKRLSV